MIPSLDQVALTPGSSSGFAYNVPMADILDDLNHRFSVRDGWELMRPVWAVLAIKRLAKEQVSPSSSTDVSIEERDQNRIVLPRGETARGTM